MNRNTFHAHRRHVKMEARADKPATTRMNASVHQVSQSRKKCTFIQTNSIQVVLVNLEAFKNRNSRNSNVVRTIIDH